MRARGTGARLTLRSRRLRCCCYRAVRGRDGVVDRAAGRRRRQPARASRRARHEGVLAPDDAQARARAIAGHADAEAARRSSVEAVHGSTCARCTRCSPTAPWERHARGAAAPARRLASGARTGASSASRSQRSAIMAPGLAAQASRDQDLQRPRARRRRATIHADLSPLGFHASVRSRTAAGTSTRSTGRAPDALRRATTGATLKNTDGVFVEHEPTCSARPARPRSDERRRPIGEQLRTYRLALITDPGYSDYFGGPPNVTAAKVALMNRVDQVYEDDISIRHAADREQRPAQPQHVGAGDGAERPVRRRGLLHAGAGHRAARARRARRFVIGQIIGASQLRHRPPRARPARRRRRQPRRRRPLEQGGRLHRHPDAGRRLLRDRLRGARDGPPVRRQPPVQRQPAQLLGRQPQRGDLGRAGQRLVDHGLRGHLPDRRPAAAQRPVLLAAQPAGDHRRTRPRTRPRSTRCRRSSLRHFGGGNEVQVVTFGPGYAQAATITAADGHDQRRAERDVSAAAREENGNTVTIATGSAAHTLQVGDVGHDRRRRGRRLQRHVHGHRGPVARARSSTRTRSPGLAGLGRRHGHARRFRARASPATR